MLHAGDRGHLITSKTTHGEASDVMKRGHPNARCATTQSSLYSSLYTKMCNRLLQHTKVFQNDQGLQTVLAYGFYQFIV